MKIQEKVFIVVPCYNEKTVIRQTLLPLIHQPYQVIVVDDGSSQDIWSAIKDLPIFYIKHPLNLGQGAALQTGMDFALLQDADIVIHFDADGQHDYRQIPNLLQPILEKNVDVVLGSRFLKKESIEAIPKNKRLVLKLASWFNGIMTGLWLTDAHNGFRALNKNALENIRLTESRMAHATEILSLIKKANLKVQEVPVTITYSEYSLQKGQSIWNSINIILDLIKKRLL